MSVHKLLETPSGNAVVVALDHGLSLGAPDGSKNPVETLDRVLEGGPDAVLVGPHFARRYSDRLDRADVDVVLTADVVTWSTSPGHDDGEDLWTPAFDVELLGNSTRSVSRSSSSSAATTTRRSAGTSNTSTETAEDLRGTDIPLVVEPVMWGNRIPDQLETDAEYVADALRMGWEFSADIPQRRPYTGDVDSFEEIVTNAPVPVMILGGEATGTTRGMLESVEGAMDAGARGLMIGRTIWKSDDPARTVDALTDIVHDGATVNDVWD